MLDKQSQEAGDNATQNQTIVHEVTVNNTYGIEEKRAREIFAELFDVARKDFTDDAVNEAKDRIAEFENILIPKMMEVNNALSIFADPSFQLLLTEAHKTAASTERPVDYELLSELLIHRVKKGENRKTRAGISHAVKIVDEISDDALEGLTVAHAISNFLPVSGEISTGLNVLDNLFGKIGLEKLPSGQDWLDHLDVFNAVRLSSFGDMKKINQYYSECLEGYVAVGIKRDTDEYIKAKEILESVSLSIEICMVNHALRDGYVRLPIVQKSGIDKITLQIEIPYGNGKLPPFLHALSAEQKTALKNIYELYSNDETLKNENISRFMEEWDKRPNLVRIRNWWDNIPESFTITLVGKVLAHVNAQRCDKNLPPLD